MLLADSDSGVTRSKKIKLRGQSQEKYWLRTLVVETDSDSGETWTKKSSYLGEALEKIWLLTSVG